MANSAAAWIAIKHRLKGVNLTCSTACSSGANAIGMALDLLRAGRADAVIAGGAEACVLPLTMNSFEVLHALTTGFNTDPARASTAFRQRPGWLRYVGRRGDAHPGEGRTGKTTRGKNVCPPGWLWTGMRRYAYRDAGHEWPSSGNAGGNHRMPGMKPDSIDYINAHATSTPLGDIVETRAIKNLFGDRAGDIAISATKSMIGHTIGASAAIGSIATIMATAYRHDTSNYQS